MPTGRTQGRLLHQPVRDARLCQARGSLCKDAGLTLTGAGSAYPYHKDPEDSHLRIAPTYPSLDEVETASELLCICVRLAVAKTAG